MATLLPLPAFEDNIVWCLVAEDGRALIVDPGTAAPVHAAADRGLRPVAVLVTHHHADHCGGAGELCERFGIDCFAPADDRIGAATQRVGAGEVVSVPALDAHFDVIATPGHTRSHIAFHGLGHLFCGDTLFSLGCGRLFEGSAGEMFDSLQRLAALPDATAVCCGHEYTAANARFALAVEPGNTRLQRRFAEVVALRAEGRGTLPSRLSDERACNPFLRSREPDVVAAAARQAGRRMSDPVDVFATLRAWKDGFRA